MPQAIGMPLAVLLLALFSPTDANRLLRHRQRRSHGASGSKATTKPWFPPEPLGEPATPKGEGSGAFGSFADACADCKYYASGSCAMYKMCSCYAANAHFKIAGIAEPTDTDTW